MNGSTSSSGSVAVVRLNSSAGLPTKPRVSVKHDNSLSRSTHFGRIGPSIMLLGVVLYPTIVMIRADFADDQNRSGCFSICSTKEGQTLILFCYALPCDSTEAPQSPNHADKILEDLYGYEGERGTRTPLSRSSRSAAARPRMLLRMI